MDGFGVACRLVLNPFTASDGKNRHGLCHRNRDSLVYTFAIFHIQNVGHGNRRALLTARSYRICASFYRINGNCAEFGDRRSGKRKMGLLHLPVHPHLPVSCRPGNIFCIRIRDRKGFPVCFRALCRNRCERETDISCRNGDPVSCGHASVLIERKMVYPV